MQKELNDGLPRTERKKRRVKSYRHVSIHTLLRHWYPGPTLDESDAECLQVDAYLPCIKNNILPTINYSMCLGTS